MVFSILFFVVQDGSPSNYYEITSELLVCVSNLENKF